MSDRPRTPSSFRRLSTSVREGYGAAVEFPPIIMYEWQPKVGKKGARRSCVCVSLVYRTPLRPSQPLSFRVQKKNDKSAS